ncbi:darobactin maturation radical SAM/SPASM protein DarE [Pseudoalteromonas luteoviolacea]|uniref:Arylsulfatase n=1 Tax=Pseudoalteromonas luteoviolacea S4054 TaxID=1129367 RepID=A0A0F6A922_9GAMM|nr:darobactin maturation radical SAM/SPASM protein DarE [Pseudoalteromonas luteoviolacea]AOT10980.1 radical SAM/SPASM domain-containing protein [Pseudoalteromonas luteoviolacea]AOT15856.1 radical SAM/SPASM domain-containing protein [Pseudoalteromonas luteoviolacea]AOT20801.1 radical SAM/SPASM domain-containing protein [Pseudoalteromonas luteoviolacea]KKE81879.1 arylsulfatase [Pseudoalteromonas luteoviolacea S4054]KZN72210.1 arylsulfatase [Pseudoalteromonas luteoviolacea S4047-1]
MLGDISIKVIEEPVNPVNQLELTDYQYARLASQLIGEIPDSDMLDEEELALFRREKDVYFEAKPLNASKVVVVLKATRLCNLRCTYCHSWAEGPNQTVKFENLISIVKRILATPNVSRVEFVWHGGEVTLLRPAFFKKLIWLQEQFKRKDHFITNTMQSNAVNISKEWLTFLQGIGMAVGISFDGVPEINDTRRLDVRGRPTSLKVAEGIKRLQQYGIPYGALIVVDRDVYNVSPERLLSYLASIELNDIEFLNIVPDNRALPGDDIGDAYISYKEYIEFLSRVYTVWHAQYRGIIQIRMFENFMDVLADRSKQLSACYWAGNCSQEIITIEPNGDVSPCDKYVGDIGSIYGSLLDSDLATLLANSRHNQTSVQEEVESHSRMNECEWFSICNGGCPHDRVINARHVNDYDNQCCGTGKLLKVIEESI